MIFPGKTKENSQKSAISRKWGVFQTGCSRRGCNKKGCFSRFEKRVWSTWKSEVMLSPPRGRPLKNSMIFVNSPGLSRENTPTSEKHPAFANQFANRPFLWFGLLRRVSTKEVGPWGAREGGRTPRKDVFLPSKHLLSAAYKALPSKKLVFTETPYKAPSKNPSKKHLLLENLLRTLLRSVLLHDPLGVHPSPKLCIRPTGFTLTVNTEALLRCFTLARDPLFLRLVQ